MQSLFRGALIALTGIVLGQQPAAQAQAQDYPTRSVTMIAPWAAGGAVDTVARTII